MSLHADSPALAPVPRQALGQHLLLDLDGVSPDLLGDALKIESILREAASLAGATPIHAHFHHFGEGMGITGVLLLRESHISIHTWPEHAYAAVDVFMCGQAEPERASTYIAQAMGAASHSIRALVRAEQSARVAAVCGRRDGASDA